MIRTPWRTRRDCPKRGSPDGPICHDRPRHALAGRADRARRASAARRDLLLQTPFGKEATGTFALRSNPIASSWSSWYRSMA
jgi:hypothetical protein